MNTLTPLHPMTRTIRVRIAVAVDRLGQWAAAGGSDLSDGEAAAELAGDPCARICFIEADVPCPDDTIPGELA